MIAPAQRTAAAARIRRRWRQLAAIGLVAGLIGGIAIAAFAGSRRTTTAYDRLIDSSAFPDALVQLTEPRLGLEDEIVTLPAVDRAVTSRLVVGVRTDGETQVLFPVQAAAEPVADLPVVEGRQPDPNAIDEVTLSERFADELGVEVGDVLGHRALTDTEFGDLLRDEWVGSATGPVTDLRVVGVVRTPLDVVLSEFPTLTGTPVLAERLASPAPGSVAVWVHLRDGTDAATLERHVRDAAGGGSDDRFNDVAVVDLAAGRRAVDDGTHVLGAGMVVFGLLTTLAGAVVVGQLVTRFMESGRGDASVLGSLGLDRRARATVSVLSGGPVVVVAVLSATAVAVVASRWTPLGVARGVEPDPGTDVNVAFVIGGALTLTVVVGLLVVASSTMVTRHRRFRRRPGLPDRVAALGGGPVLTTATGLAVGAGGRRGQRMLTFVGIAAAVAGVVAATVFASSLAGLVGEPERWGWPGELSVEVPDPVRADVYAALDAAAEVDGYTEVRGGELVIEGRRVDAYSFRAQAGELSPTLLEGRAPEGAEEIALGPRLLDELGVSIGDRVATIAGDRTVVGVAVTPGLSDRSDNVSGALVGAPVEGTGFTTAILRLADGVVPEDVPSSVLPDAEYGTPVEPAEVSNLAELEPVPALLVAVFVVIGLVAIGHTALTTGDHNRRDLAVLRALGLSRGAAARAVLGATAIVVGAATALAVPIGLGVADRAWRIVADGTDLGVQTSYPPRLLLVVPVVAVVAVVGGVLAGKRSAGSPPADSLRAE